MKKKSLFEEFRDKDKKLDSWVLKKIETNKKMIQFIQFVLLFISTIATLATVYYAYQSLEITKQTLELYTNPKPILEIKLYYGLNIMPENPTINGTISNYSSLLLFNISIANRGIGKSVVVLHAFCNGTFVFGENQPFPQVANCTNERDQPLWLAGDSLNPGQEFNNLFYIKPYTFGLKTGDSIKGYINIWIFEQATRTWFLKTLKVNLIVTNESSSGTSAI